MEKKEKNEISFKETLIWNIMHEYQHKSKFENKKLMFVRKELNILQILK